MQGAVNADAGFFSALVADAGAVASLQVGGGAQVTNVGVGSCSLVAGTCNAVVQGTTGASLCHCQVEGGNWAVDAGAFVCLARADAGSATVWVKANATALPGTPTVGIACFN